MDQPVPGGPPVLRTAWFTWNGWRRAAALLPGSTRPLEISCIICSQNKTYIKAFKFFPQNASLLLSLIFVPLSPHPFPPFSFTFSPFTSRSPFRLPLDFPMSQLEYPDYPVHPVEAKATILNITGCPIIIVRSVIVTETDRAIILRHPVYAICNNCLVCHARTIKLLIW